MQRLIQISRALLFTAAALAHCAVLAQDIPEHAQGLTEALISVDLSATKKQAGVFSVKTGTAPPRKLAVLLPGYPSVVRPVVDKGVMVSSRITGNFLIRARRHLLEDGLASLVVDCHSESGDQCSSAYQASKDREQDVAALIAAVKARNPSIREVWLVGTSMGTISTSFMAQHAPQAYAGAIHTASINSAAAWRSYPELEGFDYAKAGVPQFLVHHQEDPCNLTTYADAQAIASKYKLPLITVTGGSGFQGPLCAAFTAHGFRGKEREVMKAIAGIINTGQAAALEIK